MITVQGLTKRYARTLAVDHISFEVKKGQIVGFLGPNGAGKTTTMRILTCFLPPSEGTANVAGFDVLEQPMEVKKRIGYLPETPPVYPEMEVQEYLTFVGRLKGMSGASLAKRVTEVGERCAVAMPAGLVAVPAARPFTGCGFGPSSESWTSPLVSIHNIMSGCAFSTSSKCEAITCGDRPETPRREDRTRARLPQGLRTAGRTIPDPAGRGRSIPSNAGLARVGRPDSI